MRILISGSSGLVGTALYPYLSSKGHQVYRLIRKSSIRQESTIEWNPEQGKINPNDIENFEVIIHLAGENIASRRWTKNQKEKIVRSRIQSTEILTNKFSQSKSSLKVFLCASATGFYGDGGSETLTESSPAGTGFLAEVVQNWEAATGPLQKSGIRVANLRFGMILSPDGGALKKIILPFKMGLGGMIGSGRQFMPWIAIDDVVKIIEYLLSEESIEGPVNITAPGIVSNKEFTQVLANVLNRPAFLPLPAQILKTMLGEMAKELLLVSALVTPEKLTQSGFKFQYPTLEAALRHILNR